MSIENKAKEEAGKIDEPIRIIPIGGASMQPDANIPTAFSGHYCYIWLWLGGKLSNVVIVSESAERAAEVCQALDPQFPVDVKRCHPIVMVKPEHAQRLTKAEGKV